MKRLAILALVVACGPAREPRTVSLRVKGGPPNASVTIDDIFVGTLDVVSARGVALPVGVHRMSVEAPGYLPLDRFVEAKEGSRPLSLDVTLVPVPD
jgi:hypothetical protein